MNSRLALVTGGTRGIGKAICLALKQAGYRVIANHVGNEDPTFEADTGIPVYNWDVSKFDDCKKYVSEIEQKHGPIEILVNNAGIIKDGFLHKTTLEAWEAVLKVNLFSCFNMCHAVINSMREKGFGRIVNTASVNALSGAIGQTNYCASKAGIIGFTKALALESSRKGITVNVIAPGYIETSMIEQIDLKIRDSIKNGIPCNRFGKPDEIARAVLFLVSDDAGFITGETLSVNGGAYMK
jgi:acetoacetyl-CoA reductase